MNKVAVFIEMMSIQKYIFESNKLKENIGASYIVENIFEELKDNYKYSYVGGGNALLYFDSLEEAESAIRNWSRDLLQKAPGFVPIIAIEDNFDDENYSKSRAKLIKKTKVQENRFIPQTELSSFGITADCPRSGLSAEIWGDKLPKDDQSYISSVNYTKILAEKYADKKLQDNFRDIIGKYRFPDELDKLGGTKGENSHIAVVHIDGNDLGDKFKHKKTEKEVKELSSGLKNAVKESFGETLKKLVEILPDLEKENEISPKKDKHANFLLPVRPIVIGGDDITFVCDARVGLFLTKEFINFFENQTICKENKVTACAGISIVKTKYPFYRAYQMAEALCANAKLKRKKESSQDSYIDFHISFGGLGGNLKEIRDENYKSSDGNLLYMRPYSIKEIPELLDCIMQIIHNDKTKLPQAKVKKLRKVLYEGKTATKEFIKELKYKGENLPQFSHSDEIQKGFANGRSPYIDIIELIDFYPKTLLKKEEVNE